MNSRILMLLLLIALLTGLCTACSQTKDHSSTFSSEEYLETTRTDMTADASVSVTLEVPGKRQLSELSDTDLIAFMLENGVDFTGIPDPAEDTKTVEEIRKNIAEIEADPYGFMGHASAAEINLGLEKERRAVCTYYDWPLIRLTLETSADTGSILSDFQLWSLSEAFFGRHISETENGIKMEFVSPSARTPDFRRKMTIYLEPAEVISQMEAAEDPETNLKEAPGGSGFRDGSAIIYFHGNHDYTIYCRPEDGFTAVKIEATLTLKELADLIGGSRLCETSK